MRLKDTWKWLAGCMYAKNKINADTVEFLHLHLNYQYVTVTRKTEILLVAPIKSPMNPPWISRNVSYYSHIVSCKISWAFLQPFSRKVEKLYLLKCYLIRDQQLIFCFKLAWSIVIFLKDLALIRVKEHIEPMAKYSETSICIIWHTCLHKYVANDVNCLNLS